ncbi:hypothetical protein B0H17DRAFT_1147048 [Mycena rosella]|uniref:Uncharacterized protein n=1 Tax=Mycena rosella TaxID=1033263 RepID=A0AAD7G086_MYCRO|nr:hypothetical protein B0H17DRAFT_1147048 [Mycena rosella]
MRTSTRTLPVASVSVGMGTFVESRGTASIKCAGAHDDGKALTGSAPGGMSVIWTYAGAGGASTLAKAPSHPLRMALVARFLFSVLLVLAGVEGLCYAWNRQYSVIRLCAVMS